MWWRRPILAVALLATAAAYPARCDEAKWRAVAEALGKAGAETPDGIYRIGLPRTDLKVLLDGVELKPALALGSWLAFRFEGDQALVMGDLVLTADEVSPVMRKLAGEGIEITALHNPSARGAHYVLYARSRPRRSCQARSRSARRLGVEQDALDGAERRCASAN